MSQDEKTYEGQCYCGAVTIEVSGDPRAPALPLQGVQELVCRPGQRLHALEARGGEDDPGRRPDRRVQRERAELPAVVEACGGHLLTRHPSGA